MQPVTAAEMFRETIFKVLVFVLVFTFRVCRSLFGPWKLRVLVLVLRELSLAVKAESLWSGFLLICGHRGIHFLILVLILRVLVLVLKMNLSHIYATPVIPCLLCTLTFKVTGIVIVQQVSFSFLQQFCSLKASCIILAKQITVIMR